MVILKAASELAKKGRVVEIVESAKAAQKISASKEDVKEAVDALGLNLKAGKHRESVSIAMALLLWNTDKAITRMRREGLLRASRYQFKSKALGKVVSSMLAFLPQAHVDPERVRYLVSVQSLLVVAREAERMHKSLLMRLHCHKKTVLKTMLSFINDLFVRHWQRDINYDTDQLHYWGAEDLTLAFSYILSLMQKEVGIYPRNWQHVDDSSVSMLENIFTSMIMDAVKLTHFREAENLLDCLPYMADVDGTTIKIFSIDEAFEKSIRLGYIQSENQIAIRTRDFVKFMQNLEMKSLPTMETFIAGAFRAGMGELIDIVDHPVERLVFIMPNDPLFFWPITTEHLFSEEIVSLVGTAVEDLRDPKDNIKDILISKTLTVGDILKIQRFFSFISNVYDKRLKEFDDVMRQRLLRLRSSVLVMSRRTWVEMLERFMPATKVEEALQLLTLGDSSDYVDVQYRPIIEAGDHLVIAPALLAMSNLPRNIIVSNRLKNELPEAPDLMQEAVVKALTEAGFLVRSSFVFNINGKRETDIFCWRDGHLFIFECKNSYHPCSAHELRTSFDSIGVAEDQLDIRLNWLKKTKNQSELLLALGWNVKATPFVHTAIVTGNRIFNGYQMGDHPVRQAFELINVLTGGMVKRGNEEPIRFWEGESFAINDLLVYLKGSSIIQMQMKNLVPYRMTVRFGDARIEFQRHMLDTTAIAEEVISDPVFIENA